MVSEKLSVLVVEDDIGIRETVREFLNEKGFRVTVARDGLEAEGHLTAGQSCDVVLTDLRLPAGDGVQVLRTARENHPESYVVLMTAFASLESAIEAVRLGAFDYLSKPFTLGELDLTLTRISEHRLLRNDNQELSGKLEQLQPLEALVSQHEGLRRSLDELTREVKLQRELLESLRDRLEHEAISVTEPRKR